MYRLFTPSGFDTTVEALVHSSPEAAKEHYDEWVKNFETQGYYSTNRDRIPLSELWDSMQLVECNAEGITVNQPNYN